MKYRTTIAAILCALLTACATTAPPPDERHPRDPWEPYNRNMYKFNRTLDKAIFKPVATGYEYVMPDPFEDMITNFFVNLKSLRTMTNLTLQGRPMDTARMLERFVVNSVFGVAGLFDVATKVELPNYKEDFGQTLGVWGWDDSRYFMIPFLGPSTIRDGLGIPFDSYTDVVWREAVDGREYGIAVELIQTRANLLPRERQLEEAFDEYLFVRDAYLQNRRFKITGESETPDYDEFLDEEWDEADGETPPEDENSGNAGG